MNGLRVKNAPPSVLDARPRIGINPDNDLRKQFWAKVSTGPDCWLWIGSLRNGYGVFQYRGQAVPAHRVSYQMVKGRILKGLHMDHLCRNPPCVNPDHLEAVTQKENILRGVGITAVNARKTHCMYGHPFDGVNTYAPPDGGRLCRKCHARDVRQWRIRQKRAMGG